MSFLQDQMKEALAGDLTHEKEVLAAIKSDLEASLGHELTMEDLALALLKARNLRRQNHGEGNHRGFEVDPNNQRFFINIGSVDGLNREELMKFVTSHTTSITNDDFRDIYIKDRFSFFEVDKEKTDDVMNNITGQKYGERDVRVELSIRK